MPALEKYHKEHILVYGEGNHERLTGKHETSSMDTFSVGVGARGKSIRIPVMTIDQGKGYYEDRRPASNMNAYLVCSMLVDSTLLDGKYKARILDEYNRYKERLTSLSGH